MSSRVFPGSRHVRAVRKENSNQQHSCGWRARVGCVTQVRFAENVRFLIRQALNVIPEVLPNLTTVRFLSSAQKPYPFQSIQSWNRLILLMRERGAES